MDAAKNNAMLSRILEPRENPVPENKPASLDDIVFLPANLSRLVIDPYREACKTEIDVGNGSHLRQPFLVTGFDSTPFEVKHAVAAGLKEADCPYLGQEPIAEEIRWWQLITGARQADAQAEAILYPARDAPDTADEARLKNGQTIGLYVSSATEVDTAIEHGLEGGFDILLLDGSGSITTPWPEIKGTPDFSLLRDAVAFLRKLDREEEIDLIWFGGVRSGTDAAKLLGMGVVAVVQGAAIGMAAGGEIQADTLEFSSNYSEQDRTTAVINLIHANSGEASMMARCTGKTVLHNIEPEDLRAITLVTSRDTGIPIAGASKSGAYHN